MSVRGADVTAKRHRATKGSGKMKSLIKTRPLLAASAALAAIGSATAAQAQDRPVSQIQDTEAAGTTQAAAPAEGGQEVVVTAQKREQTLFEIPQSISVVSGATLERQQATSFQDYLVRVPGLQLDQSTPGAGRLIMRGVNTGGIASTVAVYVDETPFGSSSGLANGAVLAGDFDTFDIARVEVLRGPQGTLYGASSLGGLLKFVTNAPSTSRFEGRVRAAIETTDGGDISWRGNAMINVPLGETLAFRASGFYNRRGGFIDSIGTTATDAFGFTLTADSQKNINDSDSYGGRASLLFTPSDAFNLRLTALLQNIRADAPSVVDSNPTTLATLYGRLSQSQFAEVFTNINYRLYNLVANYDLGFATLTSSTSYASQRQTFRDDATFNLSGIVRALLGAPANEFYLDQQTNNRKFTEEVRLASASGGVFEWLIGGFYNNEKAAVLQSFAAVTPGTTTPISFPFTLGEVSLNSRYKEYAVFANATLNLSDRFHVDIGGRYSHNSQSAAQEAGGVLAGNVPINSDLRSSDNVFTYSVAPRFEFSDRASLYVRVAKGYRPGGPNAIAPNAPAGTPVTFDPDTVTSYEVGFRAETVDRSFSLDAAVFHIDWNNIQLLTVVNGFGVNINGGAANSEGFEFTATLRPTRGLSVALNGAYTNARLTEDTPALSGGRDGDRLPFTPPYSIGLNTDYQCRLGEAQAFVGGTLRYLSRQTADYDLTFRTANGRQRQVPAYTVIDLRAGVDFGRFGVEAFVRNLTNSEGRTSVGALTANGLPVTPNGAIETGVIRPRTIGIALSAGF
jgi:outer membrane receptor protein involved in Fe transport